MKDKSILSRFGIVILVLLALVLIFLPQKSTLHPGSRPAHRPVSGWSTFRTLLAPQRWMFSCFLPTTLPISRFAKRAFRPLSCVKRFNQQYFLLQPTNTRWIPSTVSYYDECRRTITSCSPSTPMAPHVEQASS